MQKTYRMSLERHNAPFRGISSKEDSVNFDLAVLHDMVHLEKISGGNPLFKGHTQQVKENLSALYYGEGQPTATIPTAGKIVSVLNSIPNKQDLTLWTKTNEVALSKTNKKYTFSSTGLLVPSGIVTLVEANPGDILSIRFKATKLKGQGTKLAIGAENFDSDGDDFKIVDLDGFTTGQYIEKRLYCTSRKDIKIVLYASYETVSGTPTELLVEDFSLNRLQETNVGTVGSDSVIKIELEKEKRRVSFLEDRITTNLKGGD